jgi:hypothetical protein
MNNIICPHCGEPFKIDQSGYAEIVKQIRDGEFSKDLHERLELANRDKQSAIELAKNKLETELLRVSGLKDAEIQELKSKLGAAVVSQKLALTDSLHTLEKERDALINQVEREKYEKQLAEKSLKERFEIQIKDRDDTIERLKDMKARLSTKMIGETLEQHCETEFNRISLVSTTKTRSTLGAGIQFSEIYSMYAINSKYTLSQFCFKAFVELKLVCELGFAKW